MDIYRRIHIALIHLNCIGEIWLIINLIAILMILSAFTVKYLKRVILYLYISFISHSNLLYSQHMGTNTPRSAIQMRRITSFKSNQTVQKE